MSSNKKSWCIERWYDEDLAVALDANKIPVTEENIKKMRNACKGIFDDKSGRNEMLADKARELFGEVRTCQ